MFPLRHSLSGQAIDKVDADIGEPGILQFPYRPYSSLRRVATAQQPQQFLIERLNPQTYPVGLPFLIFSLFTFPSSIFHSSTFPFFTFHSFISTFFIFHSFIFHPHDILWIHLHSHLRICLHNIVLLYALKDFSKLPRSEQRGSATTYIYCTHAREAFDSRKFVATTSDFPTKGTNVVRHFRRLGRRVEVAVDATRLAKRNMNVQACHISTAKITISEHIRTMKTKKMIKRAPTRKKKGEDACRLTFFSYLAGVFAQKVPKRRAKRN